MRSRFLKIFASFLILGGGFLVMYPQLAFLSSEREEEVELPAPPSVLGVEQPGAINPLRLVIPSIEVDAKIQHVGINKKGRMAVPSGYKDVAWYKLGPSPGERGNAVIAGHLDNGFGLAAVFKRLEDLAPGDEIVVKDENDKEFRFKVSEKKIFPYKDPLAQDEIFGPSLRSRLVLITCDGTWIKDAKTYSDRLVVFADLVE